MAKLSHAALILLLLEPVPAPPVFRKLQFTREHNEQLLVACNGFADKKPTLVGLRDARKRGKVASKDPEAEVSEDEEPGTAAGDSFELRRELATGAAELQLVPDLAKQQYRLRHAQRRETKIKQDAQTSEDHRTFLKSLRKKELANKWNLAKELRGVQWKTHLYYGQCIEQVVNLKKQELFFVLPGGNASCVLDAADAVASSMAGELPEATPSGIPERLAAVAMQPWGGDSHCEIRAAVLPWQNERGDSQPEVATLDAYTQQMPGADDKADVEAELDEEDRQKGLPPLPPLDDAAIFRLEDVVQPERIASEVVGSRSMNLGGAFKVEPKPFHIILEDLKGAHLYDKKDVKFAKGHAYVAIRMGRAGTTEFPQKMVFYECEHCNKEAKPPPEEEEEEESVQHEDEVLTALQYTAP